MKRAAIIAVILSSAIWAGAQSTGSAPQQTPPAAGQGAPVQGAAAQSASAQGAPAQPAGKRPPQLKTTQEQEAYNAAGVNADAAAMEKAADDFAVKFPDSEVRGLLYKNVMHKYQNANNAEKTEAMGRKVIAIDGDDPDALTTVAEVIADRTHDTDLDKDQRYAEGMKMAEKALQTVDTDLAIPPGTPQDKVDAFKSGMRAQAYSTMGTISYNKNDFTAAQTNFQKAIDAFPSQPYPPDVLFLALAIDKQATAATEDQVKRQKYAEALKVANRAVELTQEKTSVGDSARRERDRLQRLNVDAAPAKPPTEAPRN